MVWVTITTGERRSNAGKTTSVPSEPKRWEIGKRSPPFCLVSGETAGKGSFVSPCGQSRRSDETRGTRVSLLLVLPTPRRGDTPVALGSGNGWEPPGAAERSETTVRREARRVERSDINRRRRWMPSGTAKRQGRNDRSQTRMPGGVGGSGFNPCSYPIRLS